MRRTDSLVHPLLGPKGLLPVEPLRLPPLSPLEPPPLIPALPRPRPIDSTIADWIQPRGFAPEHIGIEKIAPGIDPLNRLPFETKPWEMDKENRARNWHEYAPFGDRGLNARPGSDLRIPNPSSPPLVAVPVNLPPQNAIR